MEIYSTLTKNHIDSSSFLMEGRVTALSMSADGVEVIAGTSDGFVYRCQVNPSARTILSILLCENYAQGVAAVSYASESDKFVTLSRDGTIRVWDASYYSVVSKTHVQANGDPYNPLRCNIPSTCSSPVGPIGAYIAIVRIMVPSCE